MSGAPKGTVHIDAVRTDRQCVDALVQKHGNMMELTHKPIASKDANNFSGVRFSSS